MKVTTTLIHRADGRPQIVAKAMGAQKTVSYDHGLSHDRNHGEAVGELILHLLKKGVMQGSEVKRVILNIEDGVATHTWKTADKHVFEV